MTVETVYDEAGRPEEVYIKEEPDCYHCSDTGEVRVGWDDERDEPLRRDCTECNPTPGQVSAATAAYEARVAAGEIDPDELPF